MSRCLKVDLVEFLEVLALLKRWIHSSSCTPEVAEVERQSHRMGMLCDEQNWRRLHFNAATSPIIFDGAHLLAKLLGRSSHAPRIFPIKVVWSRNSPADPRWSTLSSRLTPRFHDVHFLVTLNSTGSSVDDRQVDSLLHMGTPRFMSIHLHNVRVNGIY